MASLSGVFSLQELNDDSSLMVGGRLYTYQAGSTIFKAAYIDSTGVITQTYTADGLGGQYIALDARGELPAPLFLAAGAYDIALKRADGSTVWTRRAIGGDDAANTVSAALLATFADTASVSNGDALLGVLRGGGSATTQHAVNERALYSIFDKFTAAEITDALSGVAPTIDTTVKVQAAITYAATNGLSLLWQGSVLCGALATSAADIRWVGRDGARVVQKPAVYGLATYHVNVTGDRPFIEGIVFDGNQFAMSNTQGSNGLHVTGASPTLVRVTTKAYNGAGYTNASVSGGFVTNNVKKGCHIDCHFDDNAGLGRNIVAACYMDFLGCTMDRNGYGFQKTRANYADITHGFVAFGSAVRLRSHHINDVSCTARDNGRDGFNVNQGSYAIKHIGCLAYGNDDGGFTLAADNTGTGLPGESESCFDVEYIDCESYNNYTGGLVAYQPAHNVTVCGGRYYNNHRLSGDQLDASSYFNGIYFATGSTGINVDTKAYDDRQSRVISAIAGSGTTRTLTATGWVPGTMLYYPKVAIYSGADGSFQGYGKITAEAAGSVTIQSTVFNGVTLASITAGMYVSQAIQHNGILADNGCLGDMAIDGFGHRPGVNTGYTGRNMAAGYFGNSTNMLLPKERLSATELLANPTFDADIANWTFSAPGGGTSTYYTGTPKRSAGALRLVAGTSAAVGDATMVSGALSACLGEFIEFGGWVYASARGDAALVLSQAVAGNSTSVDHPGGGWRYLKIGIQVSPNETGLTARVQTSIGKTVYFDSMSFRAVESHYDEREFSPISRNLPV